MTTAPLTFRRYEDGDREAVWAVFAATTAQLGFTHGPGDEDMRSIPHTYLASGGEFIVGELGGGIVAHAAFLPQPERRATVRRVAVHPAFQRRGIGQALMAALEGKARQRGIVVLQLDTSQSQRRTGVVPPVRLSGRGPCHSGWRGVHRLRETSVAGQ